MIPFNKNDGSKESVDIDAGGPPTWDGDEEEEVFEIEEEESIGIDKIEEDLSIKIVEYEDIDIVDQEDEDIEIHEDENELKSFNQ